MSNYYCKCCLLVFLDAMYVTDSYFGPGSTPLLFYYSSCSSNEASLFDCYNDRLPHHYPHCNNYQEAGVKCQCM